MYSILRSSQAPWLAIVLMFLWNGSELRGGEKSTDPLSQNSGGEFVDIAIQDILDALCKQAGASADLTLVPEKKKKECLVLRVHSLPLESNLYRLLRVHNLTWRLKDRTIQFLPGEPSRPIREKVTVATCIDEIKSTDRDVQRAAFKKLAAYGSEQAVPAMLAVLQDKESSHRKEAMQVLASIGNPQPVLSMLKSPEAQRRQECLEILALMGGNASSASSAITAAMKDTESAVQAAACKAAGAARDPQSVEDLIRLLENAPCIVRKEAAQALAKIADLRAVAPLVRQLSNAEKDVYMAAAGALVSLVQCWDGDPKKLRDQRILAIKPFVPDLCVALKKTWYREIAAVLGFLGDPVAVPVLIEAVDQDGNAAQYAASALGQLKAKESVPTLCKALRAKWIGTSNSAVGSLGFIQAPESVAPMMEYLRSNPENASGVARALAGFADASVLAVIREAKAKAKSRNNDWEFDEAIRQLGERFPDAR